MVKKHENDECSYADGKFTRITKAAVAALGIPDRMLYLSKSMRKPTTIFNANVFDDEAGKIWFGDLEIERDKEALLKLSAETGPLYILAEFDGRFLQKKPTVEYLKAVALVIVSNGNITYSPQFKRYVDFVRQRLTEKEKKGGKKRRGS